MSRRDATAPTAAATSGGGGGAAAARAGDSDDLADLQAVVLEASAQFDALGRLYHTNSNYKACEQDENRVGVLDCEIIFADAKRLEAMQCPAHDDRLKEHRSKLLEDALEQVDSAERLCSDPDNGHYFGQARCCQIRGSVYVAQTHEDPVTLAELGHNLQYLQSAKEQWTHALSIFDELSEAKHALDCKDGVRRLDGEIRWLEAISHRMEDAATQNIVWGVFAQNATTPTPPPQAGGDNDGAGDGGKQAQSVQAAELGKMLAELGETPPLDEAELAEIVQQMGYKPGDAVEWDNFWLWWCSGQVAFDEAASARLAAPASE